MKYSHLSLIIIYVFLSKRYAQAEKKVEAVTYRNFFNLTACIQLKFK